MTELKPCAHCGNAPEKTIVNGHESIEGKVFYNAAIDCCCGVQISCYAKTIEDAVRDVAKRWNRRASPWVRVEDRLPEHCQDVLIKLVCCGDAIISATWHGTYNHFFSNVSGHDYPDATHWMLIPEIEG